jgi:hypothetical protein
MPANQGMDGRASTTEHIPIILGLETLPVPERQILHELKENSTKRVATTIVPFRPGVGVSTSNSST